ncbi:DUF551 domain-containing protein [Pseudomonas viridiflava]|uniref:DUF551 domain-containing protein n=1 Tax=Pseudomonas viridiflava TaxID=33069 RepID=UPI002E9C7B7C|nr:DUF551 domain-containing protein [Pseudomonas viridiflava]
MSKPSGKLEFSYRTIASLEAKVDALRQQLADVSNERDGLRAAIQWVDCSDRLPEANQFVLLMSDAVWVDTEDHDLPVNWQGFGYLSERDCTAWVVMGKKKVKPLCFATHWMPLPAAPSAEVKS